MRTLSEIYSYAKSKRDEYLGLTEYASQNNSSKMSVMDGLTWTVSACIWAFENLLDVFKVEMAEQLQNRVVGNARYYVNALLKYQSGDTLVINEEGTKFGYAQVNKDKCIITKVAAHEESEAGFHDKKLILKIATGQPGAYEAIVGTELLKIQSYVQQISFAGTHVEVTSRHGDVLVPKLTVYCDGILSNEEMLDNITTALNNYVSGLEFNEDVYVQKVIDAIQRTEHVVDVYINHNTQQGLYIAQYDTNNELIPVSYDFDGVPQYLKLVDRYFTPKSGFIKQSSGQDDESVLSQWSDSIILVIVGAPTVSTSTITFEGTAVKCGGTIDDDGGQLITAKGVCWSTEPKPTTSNVHTNVGEGSESFVSTLVDLKPQTTYYVRAYAINSKGISYGEERVFTTE